jgi:uncharacterized membrane protein YkoI
MLQRFKRPIVLGVALIALVLGGATLAIASGEDEGGRDDDGTEQAITGDALDQASEEALDYLGEGEVSGTEVEDEESYYEVEVTLEDGTQVDVQLDEEFNVVSDESDGSGEDD